ncbi:hypothetical protein LTR36_010068 [Oleoguttula mirabilis]|uniref:PWI domain-containing protein n=1 Tax=Oleoguttula mirabilis TaxID=1507867 RepID=A0AAV9JRY7_9PEZI|nr:hypothetical protein LTR36_010068 [Oleoguttula mirabilis]
MAYNYGAPPGAYGAPQTPYGAPAGNGPMGAPPGFGAPPGMAPPGFDAQSPASIPGQFQPPPNMPPNFNFAAPVIRLGVDGQPQADAPERGHGGRDRRDQRGANEVPLGGRSRAGVGSDTRGGDRNIERDRQAVRESMQALQPPTREEVARTIFVGGLVQNAPSDDDIEAVLRCAGKLRRWTRATDADGDRCRFGFAEYEDVDSLEAAFEIFREIEVPLIKSGVVEKDAEGEPKMTKLLVVVDEQSQEYIREWKGKRREDDDARQFRIDGCKEDLRQCITSISNASAFAHNQHTNGTADRDGDTAMADATNGAAKPGNNPTTAEILPLPIQLEDELSDIPAEQRATVAAEIRAFRDRSTRRDLERLRREEELEQAERNRSAIAARVNRLASPPPSAAPSGPAGGVNGNAPSGPRGSHAIAGAPAGPRGYRGAQLPNDYANGVAFIGANGNNNNTSIKRETADDDDEDGAEESDAELERRRHAQREDHAQRAYLDAERRWQNRERTRTAALEREHLREESELRDLEREKGMIGKRLAEWNDDEEARVAREEYYYDRSSWLRKRGQYREREEREDGRDRGAEGREVEGRGQADAFLDRMGGEVAGGDGGAGGAAQVQQQQQRQAAPQQQPVGDVGGAFKISLNTVAARTKAAAAAAAAAPAPRRRGLAADVEGLLEDEEDAAAQRPLLGLKPLTDLSTAPLHTSGQDLTDDEKTSARRALAAEIPTTTSAELFAYPMPWQYITAEVLEQQIRPFVEKKVLESLGVQEALLVETVVQGLKGRKAARGIVEELEPALEEEAEVLVRKVWRLAVFWGEAGGRGLA